MPKWLHELIPSHVGAANVFYEGQYFTFLNHMASAASIQPCHCSANVATENRPIRGHGHVPFAFIFLQRQEGSSLCVTLPTPASHLRKAGEGTLSVQYLSMLGFSIFAKSRSVNTLFSSVDAGNTLTCNSLTTAAALQFLG